ncbi:toxin VasX [Acinetobacter larvae]|uniref:Toxin VasX N-terminal region domain-containing protein n=1 Tax=Acinetobacter larvae TaxID=1789224 RepID=A0A1B2LZ09_9GAMM|nr:toxin VasX [Acinetobacter larvae]AOA58166.1 hypothetical protein BFG52_07230 [Acinetobacter larvae]
MSNESTPCDFCKRDEGLRVFLNRYILSNKETKNIGIESSLYKTEKEKDLLNSYFGSTESSVKINDAGIKELKIINMLASEEGYKNVYGDKEVDNYCYKGTILRRGYLYVYMEHLQDKAWQEYEISNSGFLKRINEHNFFNINDHSMLQEDEKEPCSKIVHRANALTIFVPNPDEANNVYFKYSENKWSNERRAINKSKYLENMDCFSVSNFLNAKSEIGVFPLLEGLEHFNVDQHIEYKDGKTVNNFLKFNLSKKNVDIKSALSYLSGRPMDMIMDDIAKRNGSEINKEDQKELYEYNVNSKIKSLVDMISIKNIDADINGSNDEDNDYLNSILSYYDKDYLT